MMPPLLDLCTLTSGGHAGNLQAAVDALARGDADRARVAIIQVLEDHGSLPPIGRAITIRALCGLDLYKEAASLLARTESRSHAERVFGVDLTLLSCLAADPSLDSLETQQSLMAAAQSMPDIASRRSRLPDQMLRLRSSVLDRFVTSKATPAEMVELDQLTLAAIRAGRVLPSLFGLLAQLRISVDDQRQAAELAIASLAIAASMPGSTHTQVARHLSFLAQSGTLRIDDDLLFNAVISRLEGSRHQSGRLFVALSQKSIAAPDSRRRANLYYLDDMTGLANRRYIREVVSPQLAADLTGQQITAAYLDLDKFKSVNDRLGHDRGDATIAAFGNLIAKTLGTSAVLARVGGDEFAAVFVGISTSQAHKLLQHLQAKVATSLHRICNVPWTLGVSIGYCDAVTPCAVDQALKQADGALLNAKRQGGNCLAGVASS